MKLTKYQMVFQAWIQWAVVSPQHMDNKKSKATKFRLWRRLVENSYVRSCSRE